MKRVKTMLSVLLAAALIFAFGAPCAAAEGAADAAGEYDYVCARFSGAYIESIMNYGVELQPVRDRYIEYDSPSGNKVTLNADGTGYLYLGDDNQGPVSSWSLDGTALKLSAGVSDFDGTIDNGLMTLVFDDGFSLVFAAPGTDVSSLKPISVEAFTRVVYGIETGTYDLFALGYGGEIMGTAGTGQTSVLVLDDGGTGSMTFGDEAGEITSWTIDGDAVSITMSDGSTTTGKYRGDLGVIELDISGYTGYFGQEGADTDWYLAPDSRLFKLYDGIDANAGAHLSYTLHTEYLDSTSIYDVHTKDGVYYSGRTTQVSGYEDRTATDFKDGTAYVLSPDDMTATVATSTGSSLIANNVLLMDSLYSLISGRAKSMDFTVETRELNGVQYSADVYPATEYKAETAFLFDDDGNLVGCIEGPPVLQTAAEIGESVYTVAAIDGAVDAALLDISTYQVVG